MLKLSLLPTLSNSVIHPLLLVHLTAKLINDRTVDTIMSKTHCGNKSEIFFFFFFFLFLFLFLFYKKHDFLPFFSCLMFSSARLV